MLQVVGRPTRRKHDRPDQDLCMMILVMSFSKVPEHDPSQNRSNHPETIPSKSQIFSSYVFEDFLEDPFNVLHIHFIGILAVATKFAWDIGFNDRHTIHALLRFLLALQLLMSAEMLDVLGMNQIFLFRILVVVLLEMVELVLIFVVTMMSWAEAEIR
jgi:hypothetical protein